MRLDEEIKSFPFFYGGEKLSSLLYHHHQHSTAIRITCGLFYVVILKLSVVKILSAARCRLISDVLFSIFSSKKRLKITQKLFLKLN